MRMIIGGANQGKLAFALSQTGLSPGAVLNGGDCALSGATTCAIFYGLHLAVRRLLLAGESPFAFTERLLEANPEIVIITDEIGCGVVPLEPFEREWREVTGRLCCALAQRAERVERVFCGIPTVIKGGNA